jgi:hypothetical protein
MGYIISLGLLVNGENGALSDFVWLPDSETIFFENGYGTCTVQPCTPVRDLYTINKLEQLPSQLTDLTAAIATELALDIMSLSSCGVEHPIWSPFTNRLYYSLDCEDSGGFTFSTLMSVSLTGENRVEGQLVDFIPAAIRTQIVDIHPSPRSDAVYLSASSSSEEVVNGFNIIKGSWQVLQNTAPGLLNLLASQTFDDESEPPVQTSAQSPNADYLMLGGGVLDGSTLTTSGYLATVDLTSGQVTEYQADEAICDIEWVNGQTVRYRQFNSACSNDFRIPTATWLLDIMDGSQINITADLDGFVWVLAVPFPEPAPPRLPATPSG